ncbi:hypothetical protein [Streptomyces sp. MI02-7b]|uniref:hypothetical protein n=1 Tax=Streptomyces sp. MI02-7b TaxID=462941 RepID=UPI0029A2D9C1|nr:hypothetical protein [Streptomyces sp. MI02-7b]MDX3078385.1 hypothetical protein [Streptomyces sp. MI02-7b]
MSAATGWRSRTENADGTVRVDDDSLPWLRWRLADDIHRRLYHDIGAEVSPGVADGPGDYPIGTPHCRQGDRPLGVLEPMDQWLDGVTPPLGGWSEFRRWSFDRLEVASWPTRRHLGCFHRRGKARYDLMFQLCVALQAGSPASPAGPIWAVDGSGRAATDMITMLDGLDVVVPADVPARFLAVRCCGRPLAALRTDGPVYTHHGGVEAGELFVAGAGVDDLAVAVRRLARHEH